MEHEAGGPAGGTRPRTATLSKRAAKRFGEDLRDIRVMQHMTTVDSARRAGLSATYLNNIERAAKTSVGPEAFRLLPMAYGVSPRFVAGLWFRAQMETAMDNYGLDGGQRTQVWRAVESVMEGMGFPVRDLVASKIAELRRMQEDAR